MEDLADYLVNKPKQVVNHFKTLLTEKCLITAKFGENHSFITAILKIDEKKQVIIIDCGPKEYLNKELLNSAMVDCHTEFKGIKVAFTGRGIKRADKEYDTALSIKIPEQIYWMQRRLFYRVHSPLSKKSYCSLTLLDSETEKPTTHHFKLLDLSISGFAIICDDPKLAEQIISETEFKKCQLTLNDSDHHPISFIPRNKIPLNPNKPTKSQRIGCEFINLSPRSETAFLRYMQDIERELMKNFHN